VNNGWLWCNADASSTDVHFRYFGRAVVMCANTAASSFSGFSAYTLYCNWEVEFRTPTGINVVPNQGYFYSATTSMTGNNFIGDASLDTIWQEGLQITPAIQYNAQKLATLLYPLQVFNVDTGATFFNYASTAQIWMIEVRATGTHFRAGNGGVDSGTSTFYANPSDYSGLGVSIYSSDDSTMNTSYTNVADSTLETADGLGTKATAVFLMKIPVNCDPNAYLYMRFNKVVSDVTISALSFRIQSITTAAAVVPAALPPKFVKRPDGTIDGTATQHERHILDMQDLAPGDRTPCPCALCAEHKSIDPSEINPFEDSKRLIVSQVSTPVLVDSPKLLPMIGRPKPLVLVADTTVHAKFQRVGEAKNPGPDPFRGDQVAVHNCGRQLQALQGRISASKVLRAPSRPAGVAAPKRVVPQAPAKSKSSPSCFNCGKVGHLVKDCVSVARCHACGKPGHMQKDCYQVAKALDRKIPLDKTRQLQSHIDKATSLHQEMMKAQRTGVPLNKASHGRGRKK